MGNNSQTVETQAELNLLEMMKEVVNIRKFAPQEISEDEIQRLLKAFSYGPSLANQQPWECLRITANQQKEIIPATLDPFLSKGSNNGQSWLAEAPLVFVILIDQRRSQSRLGEIGVKFSIQDTFAAIQNMRIAACSRGLATSVVREFDSTMLKEILNIPYAYVPVAIIAVGYKNEDPELPPRFNVKDFLHRERIL